MKGSMYLGLNLMLMLCSLSAFANNSTQSHKLPVRGNPVYLENPGTIYIVPDSYQTSSEGNFVILDNVKHVCYLAEQPELRALNKKIITAEIKGSMLYWTCYQFDPNYFIITP
ncbi:hypothetical protein Lmor_2471 [Legionella moravica]|uniref:Secreted protein n=1 Tax=Legionella moravica TaxID=39962 RepID=A0A378JXM8_9GAMM|nr:hypothetical protein [Legionella moravica]KTD31849.1 hypothetical protein Lmor_2471 [Legionella moravica]STX61789.1 Uncharacterised protein [Legionella moravica]